MYHEIEFLNSVPVGVGYQKSTLPEIQYNAGQRLVANADFEINKAVDLDRCKRPTRLDGSQHDTDVLMESDF